MSDDKMDRASMDFEAIWSFGIGCISFESPNYDLISPTNLDGKTIIQWAEDLKGLLMSIPSLDDVEVEGFRSVRAPRRIVWSNATEHFLKEIGEGTFHDGGDFSPHPTMGSISFTAHIPRHIQNAVFPLAESDYGGRFHVHVSYSSGMPVALVAAEKTSASPAMAVAVVREFLRDEISKRRSNPHGFKVSALGPSPLWRDCFVRLVGHAEEAPRFKLFRETRGYDAAVFSMPVSDFSSKPALLKAISLEIEDVVGGFYALTADAGLLRLHRMYIEETINDVILGQKGETRLKSILYSRRRSMAIRDLSIEAIGLELEHSQHRERTKRFEDTLEESPHGALVRHLLRRDLQLHDESYSFSLRGVSDLITKRQSEKNQALIVTLSSILSGAVGAAITAIPLLLGQ